MEPRPPPEGNPGAQPHPSTEPSSTTEARPTARSRLPTYEEFWPFYVSQHMKPSTRALHMLGTTLVLICVALAILVSPLWLIVALFAGYGPAWIGHFFFEKNRPATFTYPLWSLRGDFRMFRLTLLGRMGPELERAARLYPARS